MKIVLTVFVLMFSFACMANPIGRTSHKTAPLQGKVKKVRTSGWGALSEKQARTMTFDKDGHYTIDSYSNTGLVLKSQFIEKGIVVSTIKGRYDAKGNKIEVRTYDKDNREADYYHAFVYDTSGNLVEDIEYSANDSFSTKYIYIVGRLAIKGNRMETIKYFYDDKGQVVKKDYYRHQHDGAETTKYTYDGKGRMVSETHIYSFGALRTTYTYDEHNNEVLAEEDVEDQPRDFDDSPPPKRLCIRDIEYY